VRSKRPALYLIRDGDHEFFLHRFSSHLSYPTSLPDATSSLSLSLA
jgi:hypothetical protein